MDGIHLGYSLPLPVGTVNPVVQTLKGYSRVLARVQHEVQSSHREEDAELDDKLIKHYVIDSDTLFTVAVKYSKVLVLCSEFCLCQPWILPLPTLGSASANPGFCLCQPWIRTSSLLIPTAKYSMVLGH
jgi:hypothetical protein